MVSIDDQVEIYFLKYPLRKYATGQIMIHAGDEPQYVFYVVKGKVRQYDITYRGDEIILNVFKVGAFFPMLWAITQTPNKYFFDAESDVEVRVAPYEEVVAYLKANPDVTFDLLTRLYRGVEGLLGRMSHLMSGTARSRLLYELLIECQRFGKKAEDGSCSITINEGDLAARAGLSRETVSREIQKVGLNGLIRVSHGGILVTSLERLEKLANAEG